MGGGREGEEEEEEAWLSSRQHCNNEPASAIFKTYHQYTTGRLLNINPVVAGGSSGGFAASSGAGSSNKRRPGGRANLL